MEKVAKVTFSVSVMLYDMNMHSNSTPKKFYRSRSLSDQTPLVSCLSTFSKDFSETAGPISIKFHKQPPGDRRKKVYIFGLGHMTKMAAMPIYGKTLNNLLLQNH